MRVTHLLLTGALAGCSFAPQAAGDGGRIDGAEAAVDSGSGSNIVIPPDWWDPAWAARSRITVDNAHVVATSLAGFPVLVTLTPGTFDYARARPDGGDLRFLTADGQRELPYELDTWIAQGVSLVWVGVDIPAAPADKPSLWLYYGNPRGTDDARPAALWSVDVSVHHLATLADATGHGHTGQSLGTGTLPVPLQALVGNGMAFNGDDAAMTLAGESNYDFTTDLTVSFWLNANPFPGGQDQVFEAFVCKGDNAWRVQRDNLSEHLDFATTTDAGNINLGGTHTIDDQVWHHIAVTQSNGVKTSYVDGVQDNLAMGSKAIHTSNDLVGLGKNVSVPNRFLDGTMDELRISAVAQSPTWIRAEHDTVMQPSFVVVSPPETIR